MSFNIERKSILLGDSAKQFSSQMFANPSPLFEHMATKFKEVTGKLKIGLSKLYHLIFK